MFSRNGSEVQGYFIRDDEVAGSNPASGPFLVGWIMGAHANWMAGPSWDISNPLIRLRVAASSCFFGEPMYYQRDPNAPVTPKLRPALSATDLAHLRETLHALDPQEWRSMTPAQLIESAVDAALAVDPAATLAEAARLRNEEHIRTTPQVILIRAAFHPYVRGTGLIRQFAPQILRRADEPAVGLAYLRHAFPDQPIPNALKRAWAAFLSGQSALSLAKYRLESQAVKTVDVVNLVHPASEAVNQLVRGLLTVSDQTWEGIISTRGSTPEAWAEALHHMGHMALLRNLRNLLGAGIDPAILAERLIAGAATGQQLPFRYWSAFKAVEANAPAVLKQAIADCLERSLGALPRFPGRLMALCDNSGSAQGATTSTLGSVRISEIANLTAILAARRADVGEVGVFGDKLERFAVEPRGEVFAQLSHAERLARDIGQATENGIWLFWDSAIRKKEHWDHVFVFSDMQAGHGGLYGTNSQDYAAWQWQGGRYIDVPKLIAAYRERVNPHVMVYLVQVAGYQDTIVPEFYDRTFILGGWGEGLLRFAAEMARMHSSTGR